MQSYKPYGDTIKVLSQTFSLKTQISIVIDIQGHVNFTEKPERNCVVFEIREYTLDLQRLRYGVLGNSDVKYSQQVQKGLKYSKVNTGKYVPPVFTQYLIFHWSGRVVASRHKSWHLFLRGYSNE